MLLSARIQAPDFQKARGELFEISHQKTATFEELKAFLDHLKIEDLPSATLVHQEIGPTGSSAADISTGIHELCKALMKEGWSVL